MKYVLGVDGGATKTDYLLVTLDGRMVGHVRGGPGNHEVYDDGYAGAKREYSTSVNKLIQSAHISMSDIAASVWGLGGVDVIEQQIEIEKILTGLGLRNVTVCNDAYLGIKAGTSQGYGICSINGTGTSCAGIDPSGQRLQVGGTGIYFGDEAGGSALGGKVVRAVYDAIFRDGEETLMKDELFRLLEVRDNYDFVSAYYRKIEYGDMSAADLNPQLFKAAAKGDRPALKILQSVGNELGKNISGVIKHLDFGREVEVVLAGSIYRKGEHPAMINAMQRYVAEHADSEKIVFKLFDAQPVAGAVLWALENGSADLHNRSEMTGKIIELCANL